MTFYRACMRAAPVILFVIAIVVLLATAIVVISQDSTLFEPGSSSFGNAGSQRLKTIFTGLAAGLSSSVWPFLGSALLYRLDMRKAEAAE